MPTVALVGYTNAGKTTLFNVLTRADAEASNALFVTLDPLVRQVRLPDSRELLVSDTVGFIDRLPHALVAAFRSVGAFALPANESRDAALLVALQPGAFTAQVSGVVRVRTEESRVPRGARVPCCTSLTRARQPRGRDA